MKPATPFSAHKALAVTASIILMTVCALLHATSQGAATKLHLRLIDAASGRPCSGILRLLTADQKAAPLPGLYDRLRGVKVAPEFRGWQVVSAKGADTEVPRGVYRVEALAGLETLLAQQELDATKRDEIDLKIELAPAFDPGKEHVVAGNTHLHLMKLTNKDADEYLSVIPPADRLRVLFISYLERFKDDAEYITNRYPIGDLPAFSAAGVVVNNGEEHRHNFGTHGEGYGHVMFLNIKNLVKPVSLGPGITGGGNDDLPLRPGIDDARKQGGTVIWCHNSFGYEDVLNALTGRLHALNVFDGSRRGTFEENYYRYLNIGIHMPISTGTDWFLYDFSRVYVKAEEPITAVGWLDALKKGRNQATNGPLLSLRVEGKEPGDVIKIAEPRSLKIEASAVGRLNFQTLQLIHNGKVIHKAVIHKAHPQGKGALRANISTEVRVEEPGWFAARIQSTTINELGYQLFAHTSPIYIEFADRNIFDIAASETLLKQIEEGQAAIQKQGKFSSHQAERDLLTLYTQAAEELRGRINRRR